MTDPMTRRSFLRAAGAAALAVVVMPRPAEPRGVAFRARARGHVDLTKLRCARNSHA
jgi:hypothetical protein